MIKDTISGSAGQKPNAGATPQLLDIMVGQHNRLTCGIVIFLKPKNHRNSLCGSLKNEVRAYSLHIRFSKVKCNTQKAIKTLLAMTNK